MAAPQHRYLVLYEPAAGTLNITGKSVCEDDSANAVDSFFTYLLTMKSHTYYAKMYEQKDILTNYKKYTKSVLKTCS